MVDPDRSLLEDLVEIDEATLPFRTVKDPTAGGQGRSPQGKMRIAGAVELSPEGEPRRIRLAPIGDFSARSLHALRCRDLGAGRAGNHRWLERLLRPARPRPPAQGRRCNARPSRADVDPSCVLEPENLPWPAAAPICAAISTSSCAGTAAATPQRPSTPCSASARASDPPTTATSSDNAADPGRPGASHRPPSDPPQSGPSAGPPACLTALETNFPKSKSSRTSPGTVQEPCRERRRPINIWCDRKQREKPFMGIISLTIRSRSPTKGAALDIEVRAGLRPETEDNGVLDQTPGGTLMRYSCPSPASACIYGALSIAKAKCWISWFSHAETRRRRSN